MNWGAPAFLNFFILIPALIVFFIAVGAGKRKRLRVFGEEALVKKLASSKSLNKEMARRVLILASITFLILSLSMPQIGTRLTMTRRYGVDILVAIDTSLSMTAQDIKPNRLKKATFELSSIIDELEGDRIGILTFSGSSFVQCPLTLDYSAAKLFLSIIEPDMMPRPGTAIGDAIRTSMKTFSKKERKHKVLILLSDGEDHGTRPIEAAKEAKKEGVIIYTIGIGTKKGEPIPLLDEGGNITGYKKDRDGAVVMSRLDEETLQRIALVTGGRYYHATASGFELDKVYSQIRGMEKKELANRLFTQYEDRFQYFLGIAFILLCIEFIVGDRKKSVL